MNCCNLNFIWAERVKTASYCRLDVLDQVLTSRTFLVGERLSLADLAMATTLLPAFRSGHWFGSPINVHSEFLSTMNCFINRHVLDGDWRSQHCHLVRWWNTVLHQVKLSEVGLLRLFVFSCCSNPIMFLCFLDILVCLVRLPLVMRSQRFEVLGGWLDEYGWILPNLPPPNKVFTDPFC